MSYVEPAVRLDPGLDEADLFHPGPAFEAAPDEPVPGEARVFEAMVTFEESSRFLTCGLCSQQAVFMIPDGLRCDEHAWQAAARLDWDTVDPWVPIRIHRSTRHG